MIDVYDVQKKAKRRIKRFIKTGKSQARVFQIDDKMFGYKVKHHSLTLMFRKDKLNRLRLVK